MSWVPIFHCVWAETINNYSYCAIDLSENLVEDHGIQIDNGGMITIPPNSAYNFGLGDFTITAIFQTTQPGTVVSRKSTEGGSPDYAGWLLVLKPNGVFKMATDNGFGFYEVNSQATNALNGQWHSVAIIRKNGAISIFFDGVLINITPNSSLPTPLNISNSRRVVIGNCDQQQEPYRQFVGIIEDVTIWNRALDEAEIQRTRFNEVTPNDQGLVGFWKLDQNFDDSSPTRNNGSGAGSVKFVEVAHQAKRQQTLKIAEGTSYLYGVALDKSKSSVTFPEGAFVKVFRPDGTQLEQDSNTDDLFVKMNGDSVWAFTVKNPQAGDWKFAVECPTSTPFLLSIQTTPSKDVAPTIGNTLQELYVDVPTTRTRTFSTLASSEVSTSNSSEWTTAIWCGLAVVGIILIAATVAPVAVGGIIVGTTATLSTELLATTAVVALAEVVEVSLVTAIIDDDFRKSSSLAGRKMGMEDYYFIKSGNNSYHYFVYDNVSNYKNELVNYDYDFQIDSDTPYLYAVLTQNDNSIDFPVDVVLNIQAPDGTSYNHDIQNENSLAITSNSSIRCLIINNPQSGSWNISINAPEGVKFHCELGTVPSKDVFDTIADTYKVQDDAIDQLIPPFIGVTDAILIGNKTDNVSVPAKDLLYLFTTVALGQDSVSVGSQQIPLTQEQEKLCGRTFVSDLTKIFTRKRSVEDMVVEDMVNEEVMPIVATTTKRRKTEKIPALVTWNFEGSKFDNSGRSPWTPISHWFTQQEDQEGVKKFPYEVYIACLQECGTLPSNVELMEEDVEGIRGLCRYSWKVNASPESERVTRAGSRLPVQILYYPWDTRGNRVNLAIVSRMIFSSLYIPPLNDNLRPLIGIQYLGSHYFSIHAASGGGGDAVTLLKGAYQEVSNSPWWVAGDFNVEPDELQGRLNQQVPLINPIICPPNDITRPKSGKHLDYVVREPDAQKIVGDVFFSKYDQIADHRPVFYTLE